MSLFLLKFLVHPTEDHQLHKGYSPFTNTLRHIMIVRFDMYNILIARG